MLVTYQMSSPSSRKHDLVVLDLTGALERIAGDQSLLHEIAEIFLHDAPPLLETLIAAIEAGDRRQAERSAHALKGIAANVGGLRVERAALAVEDAVRADQLELAGIAARQLSQENARLVEALRNTVATRDPDRAD